MFRSFEATTSFSAVDDYENDPNYQPVERMEFEITSSHNTSEYLKEPGCQVTPQTKCSTYNASPTYLENFRPFNTEYLKANSDDPSYSSHNADGLKPLSSEATQIKYQNTIGNLARPADSLYLNKFSSGIKNRPRMPNPLQ